tara:strand:- start:12234 stop:12875 length:642 start_codon:yes stop_codon:yes gene_type:complete
VEYPNTTNVINHTLAPECLVAHNAIDQGYQDLKDTGSKTAPELQFAKRLSAINVADFAAFERRFNNMALTKSVQGHSEQISWIAELSKAISNRRQSISHKHGTHSPKFDLQLAEKAGPDEEGERACLTMNEKLRQVGCYCKRIVTVRPNMPDEMREDVFQFTTCTVADIRDKCRVWDVDYVCCPDAHDARDTRDSLFGQLQPMLQQAAEGSRK